jgi:hypothetical protein
MHRIATCGVLLVYSTALAFAVGQGASGPGPAASEKEALDQLLADFAAITARLDVDAAERLFLPPDGTAAGENRQAHLTELRKDWTRARESGAIAGPSVQFANTRTTVRADTRVILAEMRISGAGTTDSQVSEVEFVVALTKDGWKIVSMNAGSAR